MKTLTEETNSEIDAPVITSEDAPVASSGVAPVRARFAPSPTGHLHVGGCRTAIFAWALARHYGGQFLLRIEDTDKEREVEGAQESILSDLRWLGLEWDEGPDVGGPCAPYVQSQRLPLYLKFAERLVEEGKAYRCYCSKERLDAMREEQIAAKRPPGYDRRCRNLTAEERARLEASGAPSVIRIAMPLEGETTFQDAIRGEVKFENRVLDDFVGIKSDGFPTYNFCNVIDDHEMRITHVIRGEEFISSSPRFVVLYHHLGWEPPIMAHVPLVLGPNRAKLSKRHGDTALTEYADKGYLPEALVNFLVLLGWSPGEDREILTREELIGLFEMDRFQKHAAIFDLTKLEWMNGEYVRKLPPAELARRIRPWLEKAGLYPANPTAEEAAYLDSLVPLIQDRLKRLSEAPDLLEFFLKDEIDYDPAAVKKRLLAPGIADLLEAAADALEGVSDFANPASVEEAVRRTGESAGITGGPLIHAARVAVTGRTAGPGLFETMSALGLDRCRERLRRAAILARG